MFVWWSLSAETAFTYIPEPLSSRLSNEFFTRSCTDEVIIILQEKRKRKKENWPLTHQISVTSCPMPQFYRPVIFVSQMLWCSRSNTSLAAVPYVSTLPMLLAASLERRQLEVEGCTFSRISNLRCCHLHSDWRRSGCAQLNAEKRYVEDHADTSYYWAVASPSAHIRIFLHRHARLYWFDGDPTCHWYETASGSTELRAFVYGGGSHRRKLH